MLAFWDKHKFEDQQKLIAGSVPWKKSVATAKYHRSLIEPQALRDRAQEDPLRKLTVLEIGCGVGRVLSQFAEDYDVIGADISPNMIAKARELMQETAVRLFVVESGKLPLPENCVDFVYSFLVFQHIQTQAEVDSYVSEAMRVLKPGGYLRVQTHVGTPHPENKFGGFHGRFYPSLESFAEVFSAHPEARVVAKEHGLGHQDWLWVTVEKKS
jgi:ubiquinone/menaquinone biosynthesis C-methylase UbiE